MRTLPLSASFVVLLVSALSAQPVVSPAHFAVAQSSNPFAHPLGVGPQARTLQIHDDLVGRPMNVSAIAFRTDRGAHSAGFSVLVSIQCSNATSTASFPQQEFAKNHGPNRTLVVNTKLIAFPLAAPARPYFTSTHVVPFDSPFAYDGHGPLCWDLTVLGHTSPGTLFEGFGGSSPNPPLVREGFGTGCAGGSFATLSVTPRPGSFSWLSGRDIFDVSMGGPANELALIVIGGSDTTWLGLPLPFPIPLSQKGSSGECYINTDMAVAIPTLLDVSGRVTLSIPFSLAPTMSGANLYWQAYARLASANPLGLVSSSAIWTHFVAGYGLQPVGTLRDSFGTGPFGSQLPNAGTVTEFR